MGRAFRKTNLYFSARHRIQTIQTILRKGTAARTPPSTRAGGEDNLSFSKLPQTTGTLVHLQERPSAMCGTHRVNGVPRILQASNSLQSSFSRVQKSPTYGQSNDLKLQPRSGPYHQTSCFRE